MTAVAPIDDPPPVQQSGDEPVRSSTSVPPPFVAQPGVYDPSRASTVGHVASPAVIVTQPGYQMPAGAQYLNLPPMPERIPGVPDGLEYLSLINEIYIHQQIELLEAFTRFESNNKYAIKNAQGHQVYCAAEESEFCARYCCGSSRGFIMHVTDNFGREGMRVERIFKCCAGGGPCCSCICCDCCANELVIQAPVGQIVGYVKQKSSCMTVKYFVEDAQRERLFVITGPWCCAWQCCCCPSDLEYKILSADGLHQVGSFVKKWSGLLQERFTDADSFRINFPADVDVRMKATLIGAFFLVEYMLFESGKKKRR